ncbi:MAG: DUF4293 domain-containing protein [Bacteroidota bacterium]
MIQRIQSVILFLAIICGILVFILPVFTFTKTPEFPEYTVNGWSTSQKDGNETKELYMNRPLILMNGIVIILTIAVIFMYRNRKRQAKMCHLLMLLQLIFISLLMYDWELAGKLAGEGYEWKIASGMAFLILPVILFLIARFYINKDEALVRSADRLR